LSDLLACLDISQEPRPDVFTGRNQKLEYHRVFGGQLLAQFTAIASLTYPDKTAKPQHAVFAQEGRADEPIRCEATRPPRWAVLREPHHRPSEPRRDRHLVDLHARRRGGAGAQGRGDVLTEDGALVGSYAQEALLRSPNGG
jgi:acyl-CoA thioesterase